MKKITYILFLLLISTSIKAQFKKGSKEKIKALKIAHITEQLNFTENEAEKFWPIYNKFDSELIELRLQERINLKMKIKKIGGLEAVTDSQAKEIIDKILVLDKAIYETKKKFYNELTKVISYKKILKLEIAEKEFHRKLLRKFRGKHKTRK